MTIAVGCVTVVLVVAEQPRESVTVKLYVPAVRVKLPVPVYGVVPPFAVTVTLVLPPKQEMVPGVATATNTSGAVRVTEAVLEQDFESVTVKV